MGSRNQAARSEYGYNEIEAVDEKDSVTKNPVKKKVKKSNKFSIVNLMAIFLFLFAIYAGYEILDQQSILSDKSTETQVYAQKLKDAQLEAEKLQQEKSIIGTDQYVEKVAREKLGMVKPGEKVFIDTNK